MRNAAPRVWICKSDFKIRATCSEWLLRQDMPPTLRKCKYI